MLELSEGDALAERYELIASAADAGVYHQWHAVDRTLARDVTAITFPEDDPHAAAALDSARRAAGVDDHHLLRILDVGTESGTSYVITERLHDAESITDLLQFQTLPAEEARRIVGEAATGLHTAAARGLHHLSLSPHDIVRSRDGAVTVLGVATDGALAGLDDVPAVVASRTDTEDLVRILYAALTGRWPSRSTVPGLPNVTMNKHDDVPAPAQVVTRVPSDLDAVCTQVLVTGGGPRTPGELARLLSPWSAERVHGAGGRDVTLADDDELPAAPAATGPATHFFEDADDLTTTPPPRFDPDETQLQSAAALALGGPVRDPSVVDLEPPAPGLPTGFEEPDKRSSGLALAIVAALLVLTVVAAFFGLRDIGAGSGPKDATPTPTRSASATTKRSTTPSSSKKAPSGVAVKPVSVTGFDPEGDGNEHNELAARVIDGDTSTSWVTHIYRTAEFSGIKKGAGLLLDLGSRKQVGSVAISVDGNPTTIQVYVTDKKSVTGASPLGTLTNGSGEQTVRGAAVEGRYVILWITELSQYSGNQFRDQIAEVKVFS